MVTILHFADLHLDTDFRSVAGAARGANSARRSLHRCLERIIAIAQERGVDALAVGGDLYEHDHREQETWRFIAEQFSHIPDIPVFIAPGNHDPAKPDSLYNSGLLPDNVRAFRSQSLEAMPLSDDVIVWGAGWPDYTWDGSPLGGSFRVPEDGRAHLLLLHGTLVEGGFSGDERDYCPFNEADVRGAGFTAALLGHIHRARVHNGASRCFYPGSTQALTFNETGEHWALLFEVDPGRLTCEKIVVSDLPLAVLDVTVDEVLGEHELLERARAALAEREVSRGMAKLRLVGTRRLDAAFSAEDLAADLSDGDLLVAVADESLPGYDFEALAHGPTTRACFVRRLLAERDRAPQEEKALYQDALVLGLRAFEGAKLQPLWEPPLEEEDKER